MPRQGSTAASVPQLPAINSPLVPCLGGAGARRACSALMGQVPGSAMLLRAAGGTRDYGRGKPVQGPRWCAVVVKCARAHTRRPR